MPTLYYKPVSGNSWSTAANWFTNAAGTIPAGGVPWLEDNAFKTYDLAFATDVTVSPQTGDSLGSPEIGNGFTITGTCSIPLVFGEISGEDNGTLIVYGGTYSVGVFFKGASIVSGTFQSTVTVILSASIDGGTFQGAITGNGINCNISGGVFQSTVTLSGTVSIGAGVFNSAVNINRTQAGAAVTGGTFNSSFTQTAGAVSGGTFNGAYTYVAGNVTGGTFSNGIIYQFFRKGWPPPLVFTGYNLNALDVLGTGL